MVTLSIASLKSVISATYLPSLTALRIAVFTIFLISAPVNPVVYLAKILADIFFS